MIEQKSMRRISFLAAILLLSVAFSVGAAESPRAERPVATFSIVAYDSTTGELGVAVASKFFAVGSVVPWAKADVGAVATQAFANTTFGPRGLELMERGLTPQEAIDVLIRQDDRPQRRQVGVVDAMGRSATFTGDSCLVWAGGRKGPGYAVQGNILAGEAVVAGMETAWLETEGSISDRLYAALLAAEENGGDARGKQSAALLVVREGAGYGGYTDRAIDIRVDDSPEPFKELGRILKIAQMWDAWNMAWTAFTKQQYAEALPPMKRAAALAPDYGEVQYDLAVIRLANGDREGALKALGNAIELNPGLAEAARTDGDLEGLHGDPGFEELTSEPGK